VVTQRGQWRCRTVVIASGAHNLPNIPSIAAAVPKSLRTMSSQSYRNPQQLDDRGVLVVGASATGLQLADEIQRSGRAVTLAVGEHVRMPRSYRGLDIQRWLDAAGILEQRYDAVDDIVRARRVASPQLVGSPETLDLNTLTTRGVNLVGRLAGIRDGKAQFSGSLRNHCALADLKLARMLDTIDAWIVQSGRSGSVSAPERFAATCVDEAPRLSLDLNDPKIGTVIWATGFHPDYSWLQVPAFDRKGQLRHEGGVVAVPGLYALGLPFMRRRKSSFIHGAEDDVRELGNHLNAYLRDLSQLRSSKRA